MGTEGSSPGIKRPRREAEPPSPTSDEVRNEWSFIFTLPYTFMACTRTSPLMNQNEMPEISLFDCFIASLPVSLIYPYFFISSLLFPFLSAFFLCLHEVLPQIFEHEMSDRQRSNTASRQSTPAFISMPIKRNGVSRFAYGLTQRLS